MDADLGAAEDEAHLGTVAVGDHHVPARGDHVGDVVRGRRRGSRLIGNGDVPVVHDQGVAPHGHDGQLWIECHRSPPSRSAPLAAIVESSGGGRQPPADRTRKPAVA